jgi:iron complex transport system substrate-binding protein
LGVLVRVVSLLPAATDIVAVLGRGDQLVGRTHECDWPVSLVRDIPVVTTTSLPAGLTSREISASVGSAEHHGSSLYQVDLAALAALAPDVILTQDLCQACAVSYRTVNDAVRVLELDATVVSLEPGTIDGILDSIGFVGDLLGARAEAERVCADLRRRLAALPYRRLAALSGPLTDPPSVLFVEWLDPLMPGGHWVPEQIALAGGRSLLLGPGQHSVPHHWSTVAELAPDVIVLGPCGFTPEQTRAELSTLTALPFWAELPAVAKEQVWIVDGPAYFNRPGPRVVDGAEILADVLAGRPTPHARSLARGLSPDARGLASDAGGLSPDARGLASDAGGLSPDARGLASASDACVLASDTGGLARNC